MLNFITKNARLINMTNEVHLTVHSVQLSNNFQKFKFGLNDEYDSQKGLKAFLIINSS